MTTTPWGHPELAIWSNDSTTVAWAMNPKQGDLKQSSALIYHYGGEQLREISLGDDDSSPENILQCDYAFGKHRTKLKSLGSRSLLDGSDTPPPPAAIFFQKRAGYWWLIGFVCAASSQPEDTSISLQIGAWGRQKLATNKRDSLTMLGLRKKLGKGTGNLNWGVCSVEAAYLAPSDIYYEGPGRLWHRVG